MSAIVEKVYVTDNFKLMASIEQTGNKGYTMRVRSRKKHSYQAEMTPEMAQLILMSVNNIAKQFEEEVAQAREAMLKIINQ